MIERPKYFTIQELVDEQTFNKFGALTCWNMFDDRILKAADLLREDFGRMIINTWHSTGLQDMLKQRSYTPFRDESGLRVPGMDNFSPSSQHTFGRAIDMIPYDTPLADIHRAIQNDRVRYHMITGLETREGVTWLHIDCRGSTRLVMF